MNVLWLTVSASLLAQLASPPAAVPAGPAASLKVESVWDFIVKGGPTMIPIGLLSLVALAVVIEKLLILRQRNIIPPNFISGLNALLKDRGDRARAIEYCKTNSSPIANVLCAAVKRLDEPTELMEKHIDEAGQRELVRLRHRMRLMSALPQVSTMLGLVGTIFGMIKTFQAVAASGESIGKTERLAQGIYEAWTTTASGLLVAIPVMVAYHVLMGRIDARVSELDRVTLEWVEEHTLGGAAATPPESRSAPIPAGPLPAPSAPSISGVPAAAAS